MAGTYKLNEVAKDLNKDTKEVMDLLSGSFKEKTYKNTSALDDAELNLVFETYTQKGANSDLGAYFAIKKPEAKKEAVKEAPKKEEKPAAEPKKEEVKSDARPQRNDGQKKDFNGSRDNNHGDNRFNRDDNRGGNRFDRNNDNRDNRYNRDNNHGDNRFNRDGNNGSRPDNRFDRNNDNRDNRYNRDNNHGDNRFNRDGNNGSRPDNRFDRNNDNRDNRYNRDNNHGDNRFNRDGNSGSRPDNRFNRDDNRSGNRYDRNNDNRDNRFNRDDNRGGNRFDRNNDNRGNRFDRDNKFQNNSAKSTTTPIVEAPKPQKPVFNEPIEIKVQNTKKKQPKDENRTHEKNISTETVVVDMRSSEVNLDKYNEKYESIAPAPTLKDNVMRKQKLNQRSAKKGKPVKSRKEREEDKLHRLELERQRRQRLEVSLPDEISVGDLAALLKVQASEIIKRLMQLGVMASVSEIIDFDTASMVAMEIGAKVEHEVKVTIEERLFEQDTEEDNTEARPPIVVVMGHVDHGKTSLLDAIRHCNVAGGEAGGITQHIGAYQVTVKGKPITFLDTPGHAAFTAMRARGAQVTDIAILVVAADDGIMPQTVEAINHAKAAGVTLIVAINKMDKPTANPERIMQQLTEYEVVPEEWGGDTICVPISAKTKQGIDTLLEMVQLVADVKELKANSSRMAKGTVIEAKLDKGRGPVATILVQNGTLHTGDIVIAGTSVGRVRVMKNDKGQNIETAGPSTPVEITGLADVPNAGDIFNAVEDEKLAKELVEKRRMEEKEEMFSTYQKVTLDNLFDQISQGEMKELPLIVKGDVQGSVEAVKQSLEKLSNDEVRVRVIHGGVGAVSESDVMLAEASGAIIIGFNVRPNPVAKENAERAGVDIRLYRIIYDAIEEVETAMKGMLAPKFKDVDLGRAEVRAVYKITGVGQVAGGYVLSGKITRSANIRVVRDGIIIADDKLQSLKRFKDDVKEVAAGYECGMTLEKFNDLKEGDIFEAYVVEEIKA